MWYLSFWILPVISACTWVGFLRVAALSALLLSFAQLGMLLAMLIVWLVEGSPIYPSMSKGQRIAYDPSSLDAQLLY